MTTAHLLIGILVFVPIDFHILCECLNITKFEGYSISSRMNTTEYCPFHLKECASKCLYNSSCVGIAFEENNTRCEGAHLAYYGRLFLKKKPNSAVWVKGLFEQIFVLSYYGFSAFSFNKSNIVRMKKN